MTDLSREQMTAAGLAARRLLDFAKPERDRYPSLYRRGLISVCRTVESDPDATVSALSLVIDETNLRERGHEDIAIIADSVPTLAAHTPALVGDLYVNAFSHDEESADVTAIGGSRILGMTSNRRQDYQGGLYVLGERFAAFLKASPTHAIRALDAAVEAGGRRWSFRDVGEIRLEWRGQAIRIRSDGSLFIRDFNSHEVQASMLKALDAYLDELAGFGDAKAKAELLEAFSTNASSAALWAHLLAGATRHPDVFGGDVWELAANADVLLNWDLTKAVSQYLASAFGHLEPGQRLAIERTIVDLPDHAEPEDIERAVAIRKRMLASIPDPLRSAEAQLIVAAARSETPASELSFDETDDEENLEDDIERLLLGLVQESPTADDAERATPTDRLGEIERAFNSLASGDRAENNDATLAWGHLADAVKKWAESVDTLAEEDLAQIRPIVEAICRHHAPHPSDDREAAFASTPYWSSGDVRVSGAMAALYLVRLGVVMPALEELAKDPVGAVRYQVLSNLSFLAGTDSELAFRIAESAAATESNDAVLAALLHSLARLARMDRNRVSGMATRIFDRLAFDAEHSKAKGDATELLTYMSIRFADSDSTRRLDELIEDPLRHVDAVRAVVGATRPFVSYGQVPGTDDETRVRRAALDRLTAIVTAVVAKLHDIESANQDPPPPRTTWEPDSTKEWFEGVKLIDDVAKEIYHGSGSYLVMHRPPGREPPADGVIARFAMEAQPLLRIIATVGWPSVVHQLMETLRALVSHQPEMVLGIASAAIVAGRQMGYENEQLALGQVVDIVNEYLANHRTLLLGNREALSQLLEILNTFAEAGWEPAIRLAYRLEEIYR